MSVDRAFPRITQQPSTCRFPLDAHVHDRDYFPARLNLETHLDRGQRRLPSGLIFVDLLDGDQNGISFVVPC